MKAMADGWQYLRRMLYVRVVYMDSLKSDVLGEEDNP